MCSPTHSGGFRFPTSLCCEKKPDSQELAGTRLAQHFPRELQYSLRIKRLCAYTDDAGHRLGESLSHGQVREVRSGGQQEHLSLETNAFGNVRTNQQHNTHRTEFLEVQYPWHPLHKQTIPVHCERRGMSGVAFRCCAHGDVGRRDFDIPAWMFDPVTCSTMTLSVNPMVDMEALIQLRRLLDCALGRKEFGVVEGGHRLEVTQGGANGQKLPAGRAVGTRLRTEEDS